MNHKFLYLISKSAMSCTCLSAPAALDLNSIKEYYNRLFLLLLPPRTFLHYGFS